MLNVVSGSEGFPEAVLIRGVEGFPGPGKLTKALNITKDLNGIDLSGSDMLWIENSGISYDFISTPRIGIGYAAEEDRNRLWRFVKK